MGVIVLPAAKNPWEQLGNLAGLWGANRLGQIEDTNSAKLAAGNRFGYQDPGKVNSELLAQNTTQQDMPMLPQSISGLMPKITPLQAMISQFNQDGSLTRAEPQQTIQPQVIQPQVDYQRPKTFVEQLLGRQNIENFTNPFVGIQPSNSTLTTNKPMDYTKVVQGFTPTSPYSAEQTTSLMPDRKKYLIVLGRNSDKHILTT